MAEGGAGIFGVPVVTRLSAPSASVFFFMPMEAIGGYEVNALGEGDSCAHAFDGEILANLVKKRQGDAVMDNGINDICNACKFGHFGQIDEVVCGSLRALAEVGFEPRQPLAMLHPVVLVGEGLSKFDELHDGVCNLLCMPFQPFLALTPELLDRRGGGGEDNAFGFAHGALLSWLSVESPARSPGTDGAGDNHKI